MDAIEDAFTVNSKGDVVKRKNNNSGSYGSEESADQVEDISETDHMGVKGSEAISPTAMSPKSNEKSWVDKSDPNLTNNEDHLN